MNQYVLAKHDRRDKQEPCPISATKQIHICRLGTGTTDTAAKRIAHARPHSSQARARPLFKTLLFGESESQQQLPAVNFKKVKTYKGKLGPEKSVLGD